MIESYLGDSPVIDPTAFVHERATLIGKVTIGAECSVWPGVVMRGDDGRILIGPQTSIQDGTVVHLTEGVSETRVAARVTVGHNVILHGCIVEEEVIVGMGSILLDNARIGKGSIVGAGTLVPMNKTVPSGVLALGNPFRVVRELTDKDRQWIEFSWRSYVDKAQKHVQSRKMGAAR
jgi:carbonic anhydrase/acetyltransferase-like protein (isoleucine patch superfamily)